VTNPTFVDLFSGCGGLSIGLSRAGFTLLRAIDIEKDCIETLNAYHGSDVGVVADVLDGVRSIKREFGRGAIDLVAGGPPCQGFCAVNPKRRADDPRNSCVDMFLEAVKMLDPRMVLMENVTGLVGQAKGIALTKIEQVLGELGYDVNYKVLQAAHYGVAQGRWRLFVLASKDGPVSFPYPTHSANIVPNFARGRQLTFQTTNEPDLFGTLQPHTTVQDAISDLPPLENGGGVDVSAYGSAVQSSLQTYLSDGSDQLFNHRTVRLGELQMRRVSHIHSSGMNWTDLPKDLVPNNLKKLSNKYGAALGAKTRFGRLGWDGLFTTILTSADMYWGTFIHPSQDRVISVREAARAQTFPDTMFFKGTQTSKYRQVGNAVPCLLSEQVGKQLFGG
jgi:DNA (cytosine-5)-methyltransferase 1